MKRFISIIALLLTMVMLFSACNSGTNHAETTPESTTPTETIPTETTKPVETTPEPVELNPTCKHIFTSRIVLKQVTTQSYGHIAHVCGNCGGWEEELIPAVKSLKILAIGNSFSDNALKYLPILAKELGIEEIIVGKLYRGSCSIDTHWSYAQSGASYDRFDLNTGDGWVKHTGAEATLRYALELYDWDVITMQQVSGTSGVPSSLGNLQNLVDYVFMYKTNPDVKFYWHMTWAYSQFSTHGSFVNYGKDQMTMYNAIVDTTKNYVVPTNNFVGVIPAGTAVQNYRGNDINNQTVESTYITTDGYHLKNYSEVLVAMTWLRTLTGLSLDDIKCNSHQDVNFATSELNILKKAANNAYLNPYEVNSPYND